MCYELCKSVVIVWRFFVWRFYNYSSRRGVHPGRRRATSERCRCAHRFVNGRTHTNLVPPPRPPENHYYRAYHVTITCPTRAVPANLVSRSRLPHGKQKTRGPTTTTTTTTTTTIKTHNLRWRGVGVPDSGEQLSQCRRRLRRRRAGRVLLLLLLSSSSIILQWYDVDGARTNAKTLSSDEKVKTCTARFKSN